MRKPVVFLLLIIGVLSASCVSNREMVYLQSKNDSIPAQIIQQVNSKPYRLQTNDVVQITIKAIDPKLVELFSPTPTGTAGKTAEALYFDGFTVDDHGNIRIPILNEVNVLGLTLDEARIKIETKLLEEYFNTNANIFVSMKLSGFRYTINGEVGSPGTKTLLQEKVNILEAVANSGDITIVGDRKNVVIIRQLPQGAEMHSIDLTDISAMQSPYYQLQPNDYIYVKPLKQKSWGTGTTGVQSLATVVSLLSLLTTTILLINR